MKKTTATVPTLASRQRKPIIDAITKVLDTQDNSGTLLTTVCKAAADVMDGEELPKGDLDAIVDDVAKDRGWKGDIADVRKSEVRTILRAYNVLPGLIEYARSKGACSYHFALKLARKKLKNPKLSDKAVHDAASKQKTRGSNPEGSIAKALRTLFAEKKKNRAVYQQVWELLNLKGSIESKGKKS